MCGYRHMYVFPRGLFFHIRRKNMREDRWQGKVGDRKRKLKRLSYRGT